MVSLTSHFIVVKLYTPPPYPLAEVPSFNMHYTKLWLTIARRLVRSNLGLCRHVFNPGNHPLWLPRAATTTAGKRQRQGRPRGWIRRKVNLLRRGHRLEDLWLGKWRRVIFYYNPDVRVCVYAFGAKEGEQTFFAEGLRLVFWSTDLHKQRRQYIPLRAYLPLGK